MSAVLEARGCAIEIPARTAHVWPVPLDDDPARFERLLAPDELERAARFRFARDRRRFVVGRGALRVILGAYVGEQPSELRFAYGPYGKPSLPRISFNVSHAEDLALVAVGARGELGVDIEPLSAAAADERIPEHFFSPGEVRTLRRLPTEAQPRAFLACWTRKEAFIKARGDGLSLALDSFDVSLRPGSEPALTRTAWSALEPRRWRLVDLSHLCPGYVAALAYREPRLSVVAMEWKREMSERSN